MAVRVNNVVQRSIAPFEIAKGVIASLWKSSFMQDTFVRGREVFEKYQRSVIGDLAKLSVKNWLEEQGFGVTDWDDVRNSWRSQRKDYDLQVNNHNIEIRSSISQYVNIRDVLRNEHIIHPCNVRVKEVTIQAFFANKNCDELWIVSWALKRHLENGNLRSPRRIGPRLVDFYLMPFTHRNARPMNALLRFLRT